MSVDVLAEDDQSDLEVDVDRWRTLLRLTLQDEGVVAPAEVNLLFVSEARIAALNLEFMGKAGPTDVLSFPLDDEPFIAAAGMPRMVGDVVICPAVALRNAVPNDRKPDDELALLVVHGALHLLGWDHQDDASAELMEDRERELLWRHNGSQR